MYLGVDSQIAIPPGINQCPSKYQNEKLWVIPLMNYQFENIIILISFKFQFKNNTEAKLIYIINKRRRRLQKIQTRHEGFNLFRNKNKQKINNLFPNRLTIGCIRGIPTTFITERSSLSLAKNWV